MCIYTIYTHILYYIYTHIYIYIIYVYIYYIYIYIYLCVYLYMYISADLSERRACETTTSNQQQPPTSLPTNNSHLPAYQPLRFREITVSILASQFEDSDLSTHSLASIPGRTGLQTSNPRCLPAYQPASYQPSCWPAAPRPRALVFYRAHSQYTQSVSIPGKTGLQAAGLQPPGLEH